MIFYPNERIALFVDGINLYSCAKALGFDIDYKKLLNFFSTRGVFVRAFYYTLLSEDKEYSPLRPLTDWLTYNNYRVVTRCVRECVDGMGRSRMRGRMDIELVVDFIRMAESVDHLVLFSGDGDFQSMVEYVQNKGRRISVISTVRTQPAMVSDELRRRADQFIELDTLRPCIERLGNSGSSDESSRQSILQTAIPLCATTSLSS